MFRSDPDISVDIDSRECKRIGQYSNQIAGIVCKESLGTKMDVLSSILSKKKIVALNTNLYLIGVRVS